MNYIRACQSCGGPIFGTWLYSYHMCRATLALQHLIPAPIEVEMPPMSALDHTDHIITPGEATRLCSLIQERITEHCEGCKWCQMLKEQGLMCIDGLRLRDALKKWQYYTLIEVDRSKHHE